MDEGTPLRVAVTVVEALEELRRRGEVLVPNLALALAVRREAQAQGLAPVIVSGGAADGTRVHLQLAGPGARIAPRSEARKHTR